MVTTQFQHVFDRLSKHWDSPGTLTNSFIRNCPKGAKRSFSEWVIGNGEMLLFAGLMGMMALGATAFMGVSGDEEIDETIDNDTADQEAQQAAQQESSAAESSGMGILDFLDGGSGDLDPDQDATDEGDMAPNIAPQTDSDLPDLAGSDGDAAADDAPDSQTNTNAGLDSSVQDRIQVGSDQDDTLIGTDDVDLLNGGDGDDTLSGKEGDDELFGALGDDTLAGDEGDDSLHGDLGDDQMHGGTGNDELRGYSDDDALFGEGGDDTLIGGAGDDSLTGGAGDDALHGGLDNDHLHGGDGHDTLFGGWGDDTLSGFEDDPDTDGWNDIDVQDFLNGGGGNDMITAGAGDIVTTDTGADTVLLGEWLSADHQAEVLDFDPSDDTLMIVFDDLTDPEPDVDLALDPDNPDHQQVLLNGVAIASINNAEGLNLGHITLIGHSLLPQGAML